MLRTRINSENCISVLPCALNILFNNYTEMQLYKVGQKKRCSSRGCLLDNQPKYKFVHKFFSSKDFFQPSFRVLRNPRKKEILDRRVNDKKIFRSFLDSFAVAIL